MFSNKVTFDVMMECVTPYIGEVCRRETFFNRKNMSIEDVLSVIENLKPCIDMDDEDMGQIFMAMYKATRDFEKEDYSSVNLESFCASYSTLPLDSSYEPSTKESEFESRGRAANYFGLNYKPDSSIVIYFDPVFKERDDA